jgi:hypothetical protein
MVTKLRKTKHGVVILLPDETLESVGLSADSEVSITVRPEQGQIVITSAGEPLPEVDEEFARQVSEFIDQYRPALAALAR